MRPHPKEILECCNAITELCAVKFSHLTSPDMVFVHELLKTEYIQQARDASGFSEFTPHQIRLLWKVD